MDELNFESYSKSDHHPRSQEERHPSSTSCKTRQRNYRSPKWRQVDNILEELRLKKALKEVYEQ